MNNELHLSEAKRHNMWRTGMPFVTVFDWLHVFVTWFKHGGIFSVSFDVSLRCFGWRSNCGREAFLCIVCPGEGHFHVRPVEDVPTFRVSIFRKNSKTGLKISVKIPEQASHKPMIFQSRSSLS